MVAEDEAEADVAMAVVVATVGEAVADTAIVAVEEVEGIAADAMQDLVVAEDREAVGTVEDVANLPLGDTISKILRTIKKRKTPRR